MAHSFLVLILFFAFKPAVFANSCCGQSPASYTVLSLNQRLSLSANMSYLRSYGRFGPNANGGEKLTVWNDKNREITSVLFNAASVIAPRQQIFMSLGSLQGRYSDNFGTQTSSHFSDTILGYSFEAVPEYSFSPWKPIVFLTAFLNLPTGHSTFEMNLSEGTDVTGHNQWGAGLGLTARKVYFPLTLTFQARTIQLFSKTFGEVKVSNFYDSSLALLVNYSSRLWDLQFNGGVTFSHLSERSTRNPTGSRVSTSAVTQNFTTLGGVQRAISEDWVAGVNYADQTLVGPAKNSILNRSISLSFNYNYF